MADHYYSITLPIAAHAIGGAAVAKGTSTASGNFELRVTDGVTGMRKIEVLKGIEAIRAYIEADGEPA